MKNTIIQINLFLIALLIVNTADAALIESDLLLGSGDRLITVDTATGLEWLDLTQTAGFSYNEIISGAGEYLTTAGFRYATLLEVQALVL